MKFKTAKALQKLIDEYFVALGRHKLDWQIRHMLNIIDGLA